MTGNFSEFQPLTPAGAGHYNGVPENREETAAWANKLLLYRSVFLRLR